MSNPVQDPDRVKFEDCENALALKKLTIKASTENCSGNNNSLLWHASFPGAASHFVGFPLARVLRRANKKNPRKQPAAASKLLATERFPCRRAVLVSARSAKTRETPGAAEPALLFRNYSAAEEHPSLGRESVVSSARDGTGRATGKVVNRLNARVNLFPRDV